MNRAQEIENQSPWLVILRNELEEAVCAHEQGEIKDAEFIKRLLSFARRANEL